MRKVLSRPTLTKILTTPLFTTPRIITISLSRGITIRLLKPFQPKFLPWNPPPRDPRTARLLAGPSTPEPNEFEPPRACGTHGART